MTPRWVVEKKGLIGAVKWFDENKRFGFIYPSEDDGKDVFLHAANILDKYVPQQGDRIQYDLGSDKSGRNVALNIIKI